MTTLIAFLTSSILALFTPTAAAKTHHLEGVWENNRSNLSIRVESIRDGIRVKRLDRNRWHSYTQVRDDQYQDRDGNTYFLIDQNTLEWEDRKGQKRIRFYRDKGDRRDNSYRSRDRDYHRDRGRTQLERNHYYGSRRQGSRIAPQTLSGTWINPTTGQRIRVKTKRGTIKVRAHRGGWTTFYPADRNTFRDRQGNKYDVYRGEMVYTSRNRDFVMRFIR